MADTEDEIVVALEPDLFAGQDKKTTDADPVANLKEQFKELQSQAERDRAARQDAERRAASAAQEAERARKEAGEARGEAIESQHDTVASGIATAQAGIDAAKRDIKTYGEAGDYDKQADAYDNLAAARAKLVRLDEAKAELDARKKASSDESGANRSTARPESATAADPVEAYIANRPVPTQTWLRAHQDWITDPRKNAKLTAGHYSAQSEGITVDTPEYFEHVEAFIGLRPERHGNGHAKPGKKPPVFAAPVTASGGGTGGGGTEVRLTKGEAEAATDGTLIWNYDDPSPQKRFKSGDPIGIQEMARRKLDGQKRGLYDRSYTES